MTTLMQASTQWATRPADERFASLLDLQTFVRNQRAHSLSMVRFSRDLEAVPVDNKGLMLRAPSDGGVIESAPTHWSFGQLSQLAEAPAGYLRSLPAPMAADCLNYGLQFKRQEEEVGLLSYKNGGPSQLRAATGPRYGRIWNEQIVDRLVERFGDGLSGDFRVPGEFGKDVEVTKANTTLFASDRDFFVFLADEKHRIEIPDRRDGHNGTLARGFFVWNSEVGKSTLGIATFLFDYVCCNRIVWGSQDYAEVILRHTAKAPERFADELMPALDRYAQSSTASVTKAIENARADKIDDVSEFLAKRFSRQIIKTIEEVHVAEEGRPIETRWDVVTAVTAYARSIEQQDRRVDLERQAGDLMPA